MCDCKERIEQAVKTINNIVNRVLIFNRYEGYELMKLKEALKLLIEEADKK